MWRWLHNLKCWLSPAAACARHLQRGSQGERIAREFLLRQGWRLLAANYRVPQGEIDLVFRDDQVLVFVEVKTRADEHWERPAAAVNAEKRRRVSRAALAYLNELGRPRVKFRFDIVEVVLPLQGEPIVRHWPNAFQLATPYRYAAAPSPGGRRQG